MSQPFNGARLKTSLKMAISKLKFLQEKKLALSKQQRRQLADLLGSGKETSATIRVENIIREDIYVELLEYLELYCELLLARVSMVLDLLRTEVDAGLLEAVALVIYSYGHVEIKEVASLGEMLKIRYGPEFARRVSEDKSNTYVPEKITRRCDIEPPSEELVSLYLAEIARTYEVPYSKLEGGSLAGVSGEFQESGSDGHETNTKHDDSDNDGNDDGPGTGGVAELESGLVVPGAGASSNAPAPAPQRELSDFDKLKERFAALKR